MIWKSAVTIVTIALVAGCGPQPDERSSDRPGETARGDRGQLSEPEPSTKASGRIIEVAMLTRDPNDPDMMHLFEPRLIRAEVGDTITFVPTDPNHQSSSVEGMLPEGVKGWEGEINQRVSYVLPRPGIYGYQCVPHYGAGMVGLIIVEGEGMTDNLEAAKAVAHPGLAGSAFNEIFAEARARGLLSPRR